MLEDRDILAVNSPREHVEGPYTVVYKTNEWAIVTLCYDKRPCLGIRWFDAYGGNGNPTSRGMLRGLSYRKNYVPIYCIL